MKELVTFRKYLTEGVINEDELDDLLADLEGELDDELENNPDSKKKEAFSDLTSWEDVWKKAQKAIEDHFAHHVEKEFAIEDYAYDCNDSESYNTRVLFKYSPRSEGMTGNYFLSLWKGHFDGEINDDFMDYFSGETISSYLLFANNKSDNFESDIYKKFQDSLYSRVKDYVDAGIEIWDDKQVADYCASEGEKDINEELTSFRKYLNEGVINEESDLDQIRKKYGNSEVIVYNSIFVERDDKYIGGVESWSMSVIDILEGIEEDSLEMEMDYEELLEDLEGLTTISDDLSPKEIEEFIEDDTTSSESEGSLNQNIRVMGSSGESWEVEDGEEYDENKVDVYSVLYSKFLIK